MIAHTIVSDLHAAKVNRTLNFEQEAAAAIIRAAQLPPGEKPTPEDAAVLARLMAPGGLVTLAMRSSVEPGPLLEELSPEQLEAVIELVRKRLRADEAVKSAERNTTGAQAAAVQEELTALHQAHEAGMRRMELLHKQLALHEVWDKDNREELETAKRRRDQTLTPGLFWIKRELEAT